MEKEPPRPRPHRRRRCGPAQAAHLGLAALGLIPAAAAVAGGSLLSAQSSGDGSVHRNVGHVVHVVIDGLRSDALLPGRSSIFDHVRQHGACTLNARPDARSSQTLPNHIGMFSGINVADHGYREDNEPKGRLKLVDAATGRNTPFHNIFDLVAESGLGATAFYASKDKFDVFEKSWNITDYFNVKENDWHGQVAGRFIDAMTQREFAYSYVHLAAPDMNGHKYNGGLSRQYQFGVKESADHLWQILDLIHRSPVLRDDTAVIITADHGFSDKGNHADRSDPHVHDIPFCVYGPGVKPGGDLYELNPSVVENPGNDQADGPYWRDPLNVGRRPIRNVYAGVLAADLLGLHPGPGYGGFSDQYLVVGDLDSLTLVPPWPATRDPLPTDVPTDVPTFAPTEVPTAVPTSSPTPPGPPTPIGRCAGGPFGDGPRARACGATNRERPRSCCPGYMCSDEGYYCVLDRSWVPPTPSPTEAPTEATTPASAPEPGMLPAVPRPGAAPTAVPVAIAQLQRPPTRSPAGSATHPRNPSKVPTGWEGFLPPLEEAGTEEAAADETTQEASSGQTFGTVEIIILTATLGSLVVVAVFLYGCGLWFGLCFRRMKERRRMRRLHTKRRAKDEKASKTAILNVNVSTSSDDSSDPGLGPYLAVSLPDEDDVPSDSIEVEIVPGPGHKRTPSDCILPPSFLSGRVRGEDGKAAVGTSVSSVSSVFGSPTRFSNMVRDRAGVAPSMKEGGTGVGSSVFGSPSRFSTMLRDREGASSSPKSLARGRSPMGSPARRRLGNGGVVGTVAGTSVLGSPARLATIVRNRYGTASSPQSLARGQSPKGPPAQRRLAGGEVRTTFGNVFGSPSRFAAMLRGWEGASSSSGVLGIRPIVDEGEPEAVWGAAVAAGRASPQRIGPPSLSRAGARDTYETMDLAIHMGVWPEKLAPVGSDAEFDALAGSTPFEGDNPEVERGEGTGPHGNQAPVGPGSTHRMGTSPKSPSRRPRSKSDPTRPVSPRRVWL